MRSRGGIVRPLLAIAPFLAILLLLAAQAHAAAITPNTIVDELNSDGDCSLREAIQAANTNAAVDACAAGEPVPTVDVIGPVVTGTIILTSGTLSVTDDLTIDGPGVGSLTISGNNASAVLTVDAVTVNLHDLTIADGSTGAGGGGIWNQGTLTLHSSKVSGNTAPGSEGGGILNSGTLELNDSTVSGNTAARGGGIDSEGGQVALKNSSVADNAADEFGGGIFADLSATVTLSRSTVSGNTATFAGGGIINSGSTVGLDNSTVSGNTTLHDSGLFNGGGGIFNNSGPFGALTLNNSTVSNNLAVGDGGGIRNYDPSQSTTAPKNTIVASNSGNDCHGTITSAGHNLDSDDTCGLSAPGDLPGTDPMLGSLQNNGGPTETHLPLTGSPVIDAGSPDCPPSATDQRGIARPQGAACDIGAVEVVLNSPPDCSSVSVNPKKLWPPNHKLRLVALAGATDPDRDAVTLTITTVMQDEPLNGLGDGDISPDARATTQSNKVLLRAERSGQGDGRVYRVSFTGSDAKGGNCSGVVTVGIPKNLGTGSVPIDSAPPSFSSFGP